MKLSALALSHGSGFAGPRTGSGVGGAAHADGDLAALQALGVAAAGVLHAPVGVVNEAVRGRVAREDRVVQRLDREPGFQMIVERPAHDLARERVEHDGDGDGNVTICYSAG
jgi:hypothetical protein